MKPGVTVVVVPATAPTPWSMLSAWAPVTLQFSVTVAPGGTFDDDAVKDVMTGTGATMQVPDEHAIPVPHPVPSGLFPSTPQVGVVADGQDVTPVAQGFVG